MAITDFLKQTEEKAQQGSEEVKEQETQEQKTQEQKTQEEETSSESKEETQKEEPSEESTKEEEASAQESSQEDSQTTSEETEEEEQATPQDYAELIKEQLSERGVEANFESIDELAEKLKSANESPFATDAVKEINEFIKKGEGDIGDYIKYKQTDFDNMDGLALVRMQTKEEYPNLSNEQIENYINDHYALDEDEYTEREVSVGKTRLAMDAEKARKQFLNRKQKLQAKLDEPYQPPQQQEQKGPTQEEVQQFNQQVDQTLKDSLTFQNGEFNYQLKDEVAQKIPKNLGEMFLDKDGKTFDFKKFNKARVFANDPEGFVNAAIEHGKSLEREAIKKDRYNQDLEGKSTPPKKDEQTFKDTLSVFGNARKNKIGFG